MRFFGFLFVVVSGAMIVTDAADRQMPAVVLVLLTVTFGGVAAWFASGFSGGVR